MNKSEVLKGFWPTEKRDRLTMVETAEICRRAGWRNKDDLAIAVAVASAESARDPIAYLSYLDVPGSATSFKPWERRAYKTNIEWLGTIPISPGPTLPELLELFEQRALNTPKPWLHVQVQTTTGGRPRVDFGLFQLNSKYQPITPNPYSNAVIAHGMWKSRGWTPWVAYNKALHKKFLAQAKAAVSSL